jgi:hypothetical protein
MDGKCCSSWDCFRGLRTKQTLFIVILNNVHAQESRCHGLFLVMSIKSASKDKVKTTLNLNLHHG